MKKVQFNAYYVKNNLYLSNSAPNYGSNYTECPFSTHKLLHSAQLCSAQLISTFNLTPGEQQPHKSRLSLQAHVPWLQHLKATDGQSCV